MTLSLASNQGTLLAVQPTVMLTLVKQEFFSNYDAGTVSETMYWSYPFGVRISYDGAVRQFRGRVNGTDPISSGFEHMPDATKYVTRTSMTMAFDTTEWVGEFLFERLTSTTLIGSRVEISTVMVSELDKSDPDWANLGALAEEYVVRFRGEVTDVSKMEADRGTFSLLIERLETPLDWPFTSSQNADPRDLGKRYPIVVGAATRIPCINRVVGASAILSEDMSEEIGSVLVTDASVFPSTPFEVVLDAERITVTQVNTTTSELSGLVRGESSTKVVSHRRGSVMVVLTPTILVASGVESAGVTALYVRAPDTSDLIRIDPTLYSVDASDNTTDPAYTMTTVSLTSEGLYSALKGAEAPEIATQPVFADVPGSVSNLTKNFSAGTATTKNVAAVYNTVGATTSSNNVSTSQSGGSNVAVRYWNDADLGTLTENVNRFRLVLNWELINGFASGISLKCVIKSLFGNVSTSFTIASSFSVGTTSGVFNSAWFSPPAGTTVADLSNGVSGFNSSNPHLEFYVFNGDNKTGRTGTVIQTGSSIEVESIESANQLVQTTDVTIAAPAGAKSGFGLEFFADFVGQSIETPATFLDLSADASNWTPVSSSVTDSNAGEGLRITQTGPETVTLVDTNLDSGNWDLYYFANVITTAFDDSGTVVRLTGNYTLTNTRQAAGYRVLPQPISWGTGATGTLEFDLNLTQDPTSWTGNLLLIQLMGSRNAESSGYSTGFPIARWSKTPAQGLQTISIDLSSPDTGNADGSGTYLLLVYSAQEASEAPAALDFTVDDIELVGGTPDNTNNRTIVSEDLSAKSSIILTAEVSAADWPDLDPSEAMTFWISDSLGKIRQWVSPRSLFGSSGEVNSIDLSMTLPTFESAGFDDSDITKVSIKPKWTDTATSNAMSFGDIEYSETSFITHPMDIASGFLSNFAGLGASSFDAASFNQVKQNTPGVEFSGDLRTAGSTIGEILSRIGFESRANFYIREDLAGPVYVASSAGSDNLFPGATIEIEEPVGIRAGTRNLIEQPTRFSALFDFKNEFAAGDLNGYRGSLISNETTNDLSADGVLTSTITDAQLRVGKREAEPMAFDFLNDTVSAKEVFSYYVFSALQGDLLRVSCNVSLAEGYDLEPSDIRLLTVPWRSSPLKGRIVRVVLSPMEGLVSLNIEEVR